MRAGQGARTSSAAVVGTAVVLWGVSERAFWATWRPDDTVVGLVLGLVGYGVAGYLLLHVTSRWPITGWAGWVVLGAGYGWLVEGVLATTVYGDADVPFPFTLSWTALAWHMPLSVVVGWVVLPRALATAAPVRLAAGSAAAGAWWGVWTAGWGPMDPVVSGIHTVVVTTMVVAGAAAVAVSRPVHQPARSGLLVAGALVVGWVVLVDVPAVGGRVLLVVPLLGGVALLLRRAAGPDRSAPAARPRWGSAVVVVLCCSVAAVAVRGVVVSVGTPVHPVVAVLTGLGGAVVFGWAVVRLWRSHRVGAGWGPESPVQDPCP